MKKFLYLLLMAVPMAGFGQQHPSKTYLFVPGAWDGGWDYARVDSALSANGDRVYRPTLTGLGERVHLANPEINLSTYIQDIVNMIRFENLHDIILVGHSYGGMVISGVAEVVPERIKQLIYLDAMIPNNGESAKDVCGVLWEPMVKDKIKDGMVLYPFGVAASLPPTDVPQPLKTFTEPVTISNPLVKKIPSAFISMIREGRSSPAHDQMGVVRAKARSWKIFTFEGGHYFMREQPENLAKKLTFVTTALEK